MTKRTKWALTLLLFIGGTAYGQVSGWSTARHVDPAVMLDPPVNILDPPVNTSCEDMQPFLSKDRLSFYFARRCGALDPRSWDIWVARRGDVNDPWGAPENLGATINSDAGENFPRISADGQQLYFQSSRNTAGSRGGSDLWVSRWEGSAWGPPENLGDGVNTSANEDSPAIFEDPVTGRTTLFFVSDRPGGLGLIDIYTSTMQADGFFGPAVPVSELNTTANDMALSIRQDGLEIFFTSNRPGSILNFQNANSFDIWTSTRATTSDPWSTPTNLDPGPTPTSNGPIGINTRVHEAAPGLSFDGMTLYFHAAQRIENVGAGCLASPRPDSTCYFDIWVTTRPDTTPPNAPTPHVSPVPNAAGWNNSDAVVSFTSNGDVGPIFSGVANCSADVPVTAETSSDTVSGTCTDVAGNTSEPAVVAVKIDKTIPAVAVTGVSTGATYLVGNVPAAGCSSSDVLSGLASAASLLVTGGSSNGVGAFTATCSGATDIAGNVAPTVISNYGVTYAFSGFLPPLAASGFSGTFRLGSTIPTKWQLRDGNGAFITSPSAVRSLQVAPNGSCLPGADENATDPSASGATGLRYDMTSNQFIFNWQTRGLATGCYDVLLTLDDSSVHSTIISLK